jgi:hypothetical protein
MDKKDVANEKLNMNVQETGTYCTTGGFNSESLLLPPSSYYVVLIKSNQINPGETATYEISVFIKILSDYQSSQTRSSD